METCIADKRDEISKSQEVDMSEYKPIMGITMGDPAGIGPEIAVKALGHRKIYDACRPVIVGDAGVMRHAVGIAGVPLDVRVISGPEDGRFEYGTIDLIDLKNVDMEKLKFGKVSAMAGNAAFEAVKKVIELAMESRIDATVTGPINKEAINLAGHHYSGHTEIYAQLTNTGDYTMMLAEDNIELYMFPHHVP